MQFVYAEGQRDREFLIAGSRGEVPSGARVYATCTAEAAREDVGEITLQTMTDEEFYALRIQVREARERAKRERHEGAGAYVSPRPGPFGKPSGR